jgi:hypothetical protein
MNRGPVSFGDPLPGSFAAPCSLGISVTGMRNEGQGRKCVQLHKRIETDPSQNRTTPRNHQGLPNHPRSTAQATSRRADTRGRQDRTEIAAGERRGRGRAGRDGLVGIGSNWQGEIWCCRDIGQGTTLTPRCGTAETLLWGGREPSRRRPGLSRAAERALFQQLKPGLQQLNLGAPMAELGLL